MLYTVKQLSQLSGVSVRTLHYYDEIGLLVPKRQAGNGYRLYGENELIKLQEILFFRELDFGLEAIKRLLLSPARKPAEILYDQRHLLGQKKARLDRLMATIDQSLKTLKGDETMSDQARYSAFTDPTYQKYRKEAEARWGQTRAYQESMKRVARMTKGELEKVKKEGGEIIEKIAALMKAGHKPASEVVQAEIGKHYLHLRHFYEPDYEMYKGLGNMYVADGRFTRFYEKIAKGLARFMRDAMVAYADSRLR